MRKAHIFILLLSQHGQLYGELHYESSTLLYFILQLYLNVHFVIHLFALFVLFVPLQTFDMFAALPKEFVIGSHSF